MPRDQLAAKLFSDQPRRWASWVTAQRLADRILSPEELTEWRNLTSADILRQTRFLGVRWSAKEAAYKALYPQWRPTWKDLTYHTANPLARLKPGLQLRSNSACDTPKLHVSVSHDGDYVFTTVLAETTEPSH